MSEHTGHIVPSKVNWLVFIFLIAATFFTAWIATVDLGPFNTVVALVIRVSLSALRTPLIRTTSSSYRSVSTTTSSSASLMG